MEQWRDAGIDGVNVFHAVRPHTFTDIAELLFPELRKRGLISTDKSGTLRHKLSGGGADRVPSTHPAARYRGAFTDNSLADRVSEPLSRPATVWRGSPVGLRMAAHDARVEPCWDRPPSPCVDDVCARSWRCARQLCTG